MVLVRYGACWQWFVLLTGACSSHAFPLYLLHKCSSPHLALLWKDIGKYKHTSRKSFGQSTAHTNQMKALLLSVGCKPWMPCQFHFFFLIFSSRKVKFDSVLILQAWASVWLHLCHYNLWDVCSGANCNCE